MLEESLMKDIESAIENKQINEAGIECVFDWLISFLPMCELEVTNYDFKLWRLRAVHGAK